MKTIIFTLALIFLIGCGSGSASNEDAKIRVFDSTAKPITIGTWYKPDTNTSWQWQLQGVVNTAYNVEVYDIDLFDANESFIQSLKNGGKKVICYFSAGSYENYRDDKDNFPSAALGNTMDTIDYK